MSNIGKALLEATQDDMSGLTLSHPAQLIHDMIYSEDPVSLEDAQKLAWALHDTEAGIIMLSNSNIMINGVTEHIEDFIADLVKIYEKIERRKRVRHIHVEMR